MRLKFQPVKDLRNHLLQLWWQQSGVAVPRRSQCTLYRHLSRINGVALSSVEPAIQVRYPAWSMVGLVDDLPASTEEGESWQGEMVVDYPERIVTRVSGGSLFCRQGFVLTENQQEILDLNGDGFQQVFPFAGKEVFVPRPQRVPGRLLVLTNSCAQRNYYHWTLEIMSQLRLLKEAGIEFDWVAAPDRRPFVVPSLELLGIKPAQMIRMGRYTHLQADELVMLGRDGGYPHPRGITYLRDTMRDQPWSKFESSKRLRLYIPRSSCVSRRIVEEEKLVEALSVFGFQSVRLESLSVQQQIELFQQAEMVVAPHGAGLTNLAYCRPGTAVLEVSPTSRPCRYFHGLSHINQLRFRVYFGRSVRRLGQVGTEADIEIQREALLHEVQDLLAHVEQPLACTV
ncbi:glycosyltransferase family 61 protein [Bremerella cremea]|uniref:Glycosyltransferase family 61 protein n=1 Tax=Bremerella cremea TaxID=1031537 RepID=A0A368KKY7_9BACT|nr:glycosyltransferase family 61 protein [Bremerella cremea]RCS41446.1 glycosyltransferase family 61 protein [Bremerella cremea]